MNKTDLLDKVKSLEGLTQDERAYLMNLVNSKKKYGLVWEDKPEEVEEQLRINLPVLKEVKDKAIINGEEYPNHILIEGDNLHALTALTFTHEGKVDVIYIDPPYNTGKENEFRYNDRWILKEDPFKHSMWLNFMVKRLKIAKRLLNENGVFICHIDENEFDALNLLLETEIFSNNDFLGVIVWNKLNPKGEVVGVATMHEYVLVYAKQKEKFRTIENILTRAKPNAITILNKAKSLYSKIGKMQIPESVKEVVKPFNYSKELLKDFEVLYDLDLVNSEFQVWISNQDFSGGEKAYKFIDENGDVYRGVSMAAPDKPETRSHRPIIHPITKKPCPVPDKGWRNPDSTMDKLLERGLILFGENENKQPERKYLLKENLIEGTPSIYNNGSSDEQLMKELKLNFPYPKVTSASQYLLKNIHPNPKVILDFFAGSGTTLHATMALNADDGGNRQCILVTNNENNICEEVTYERNKRVVQGYTSAKGVQVEGLTSNNLRYYKSEFVSREPSLKNKRELTQLAIELLCIKEDCYTEQKINIMQARLFANNKVTLLILFDDHIIPQAVEFIKGIESPEIKVYVFSMGSDPYTEDFADVLDKVTLCPIPDSIYKAYQNVLPKKNRFSPITEEEPEAATNENGE
jgi:adenine-specific DNA-methyltransferase